MAQPQPQQQEPPLPPRIPVIHNAALAGAIISPLAMLLPPRRMDIRFFVLAGAFSLSTNQLAYAYTGTSIYHRFGNRVSSVFGGTFEGGGLPEGAKRTQQLLREKRERDAAEKRRAGEEEENKAKGLAALGKEIWQGSEGDGREKRRAEEHRKKMEEGQSISDLIMEQISDVFSGNWRGDGAKKDKNDNEAEPSEAARPEKK